jgi:hypothetical protein
MPFLQLLIVAVAAMVGLAALRVVRVKVGRTPLPDGLWRWLFLVAFLVVPPFVLGGITSVPIYVAVVLTLALLMLVAAVMIGQVVHGRSGRLVKLALMGSEGDRSEDQFDPPVTVDLAKSMAVVDAANVAFPRGPAFAGQIDRAGFREDWDALDGATRALEGRIADDRGRGRDVASSARATARDARGRLDTLRRLALDQGQAWAGT